MKLGNVAVAMHWNLTFWASVTSLIMHQPTNSAITQAVLWKLVRTYQCFGVRFILYMHRTAISELPLKF